jgi:hypothetical protein
MSVLSVVTLRGDPEQVVTYYGAVELETAKESRISHTWATVDDGVVVADWWESEDALQSFVEKLQLRQGMEDDQGKVEVLEVHTASPPRGDLRRGRGGNERPHAAVRSAWPEEGEASAEAEDGFDAVLKLFDWVN